MRKAILPRLYALLRHACFGSAAGSMPALLPLLTLLPVEVLGPQPDVLSQVLDSVWAGLTEPTLSRWVLSVAQACMGLMARVPSKGKKLPVRVM